jgi:hypothetical protein
MGLFSEMKIVAETIRDAGNIDLYSKVLDLCSQVLEHQNKIAELQQKNDELKNELEIKDDIERYPNERFITRKSENSEIKYCGCCWGAKQIFIPIASTSRFQCSHCKAICFDPYGSSGSRNVPQKQNGVALVW